MIGLERKDKLQVQTLRIKSYREEVINSASLDLEWVPYKGPYQHSKTHVFAAAFCTNWGEKVVLHITNYHRDFLGNNLNAERALIRDILSYFNQFPLTFGWYTTGVAVYDNKGNRKEGRESDFFVLHQRCLFYNLESPFELGYSGGYMTLRKGHRNKHIDLVKVFEKPVIRDGVFEGKYRTTSLDSVSSSLLKVAKYQDIDAGLVNILEKPLAEQKRYVKRDAELVMLLAQYNNCLVLRLMKVFSQYSELDYYKTCNTNVSKWYETKYKKMIERGDVILDLTPDYKLEKQEIGGGHHTEPKRGFFTNSRAYELDVKGMYPTIVLNNNISFDTLNCRCCEYDHLAEINKETVDMIKQNLKENKIDRIVSRYWVCKRRKGAFPKILQQVLSDREGYLSLLKEEKGKSTPNQILLEEYQTHQIGAKLFANAGFGLFGNGFFEFSNYKVAECITADGRRIHKRMEEMAQQEPFNFEIVFGFTDSIFVKMVDSKNNSKKAEEEEEEEETKIKQFISKCKKELGVTVEVKNIFQNTIVYGKKNRFAGWTGKEEDEPMIKGLDGLADSNPLWVKRWFYKILKEIVKKPDRRFETIPKLMTEAMFEIENEICNSTERIENELRFTQRLKKYPREYSKGVRTGVLGMILGKDKGEEVYWYETICKDENTNGTFSTSIPSKENLNIDHYKRMLHDKLKDTLKIVGLDGVVSKVLSGKQYKTLPIDSFT